MDIRRAVPADDGADDRFDGEGGVDERAAHGAHPEHDEGGAEDDAGGPVDKVSFLVPTWVIVAKFAVAGIIALMAAFAPQVGQVIIGLVAALAVAAYAGRDIFVRERLRADAEGLVAARGYAGRSHLRWEEVERLRVDSRTRMGLPSVATLEIDSGDHIFFFTRNDLGVEPDDALALLDRVRAA